MAEIPQQWQAYSCLQKRLAQSRRVDSNAWGMEAALSAQLDNPVTPEELEVVARTAARKHRHRVAKLKRLHPEREDAILQDPQSEGALNPDLMAIEADQILRRLKDSSSPQDWDSLRLLAEGYDYEEAANSIGTTPGALRVRVSRARVKLLALAA